jgi:hypothetical protein
MTFGTKFKCITFDRANQTGVESICFLGLPPEQPSDDGAESLRGDRKGPRD